MGVRKRSRLAKTTKQASRIKKSNANKITKTLVPKEIGEWDKLQSLKQNYSRMGILTDFDSFVSKDGKKSYTLKGIRKQAGEFVIRPLGWQCWESYSCWFWVIVLWKLSRLNIEWLIYYSILDFGNNN